MNPLFISEDHLDALQEVFNIAIGQAGASLASFLDVFVKLSVPKIEIMQSCQMIDILTKLIGKEKVITAVRQSFFHSLHGESITIFTDMNSIRDDHQLENDESCQESNSEEMILDISNILVGACLKGVAQQLRTQLSFSHPTILCSETPIELVFHGYQFAWENALLIQITFQVEELTSRWYLLFFVPSESIVFMVQEIDRLLN